jgi:hypothetical protein
VSQAPTSSQRVLTWLKGDVYRQIVDKVIRAAQIDFQENGYTDETLHELKNVSNNCVHSICGPNPFDPNSLPPYPFPFPIFDTTQTMEIIPL